MEGLLNGTATRSYDADEEDVRVMRNAEKKRRKERRAARKETERRKLMKRADGDEDQEEEEEEEPVEKPRSSAGGIHSLPATKSMSSSKTIAPSPSSSSRPPTSGIVITPAQPVKHAQSQPSVTPGPSKRRRMLEQPRRPPSSAAHPEDRKQAQPDDDELRYRFAIPGAMEEYLASKWMNLKELKRLADAGVLSYKKGKFSATETDALRKHLGLFARMNRLDDDEMVRNIMAKRGRDTERKDFPKFWMEVAAVVPGRPIKYVKDHVKRLYDPRGNKGPWTAEEDAALLRAYTFHPGEWVKIAEIVERTEVDVRDRYKNQLQHRLTKRTGHWDQAEIELLIRCIREANDAIARNSSTGNREAPWDVVAEKMGGRRTRMQCRKKWQDGLWQQEQSGVAKETFRSSDRSLLIQRVKALGVETDSQIPWEDLALGKWRCLNGHILRQAWWRMKVQVPDHKSIPFPVLLSTLAQKFPAEKKVESAAPPKNKKRESPKEKAKPLSLKFVVSDEEEDVETPKGEPAEEVPISH